MNTLKMPDITPAQIAAAVKLVVGLGTAVGLNIDGELSDSITAVLVAAVALVSGILTIADAVIRGNRAKMKALGGHPDALVADN